MSTKKQPVVKKEVPTKKSKEVSKSSPSDIPEEQKCLTASVKIEDGVTCCTLNLSEDDMKTMAKSTGCKVFYAAEAVITQGMKTVSGGLNSQSDIEAAYNDYLAMMSEFKPQDAFEGMLASQMNITYIQALDCMRTAAVNKEYSKVYARLQNQGIKLMRLYNYQLETLDKHRRKGKQKMTVEHVHVHEGGQAIVGNVTQGEEGASNEK